MARFRMPTRKAGHWEGRTWIVDQGPDERREVSTGQSELEGYAKVMK